MTEPSPAALLAEIDEKLKDIAPGEWAVYDGWSGSQCIASMTSWEKSVSVNAPDMWWAKDGKPLSSQRREYMARCHAELLAAAPRLLASARLALVRQQEALEKAESVTVALCRDCAGRVEAARSSELIATIVYDHGKQTIEYVKPAALSSPSATEKEPA